MESIPVREIAIALVAGLLMVLGLRLIPRLLAGVGFIGPREVKQRLDSGEDALVLDVREPDEFKGPIGHVPGSVNLPMSSLSARLDSIREDLADYRDTPVYVMCHSATRSASAARMLRRAGLTKVQVVAGGMVKWTREKLPTTRK